MIKRVNRHLLDKLLKLKGYDILSNHYIFSDPRGGSTWLMEIVQKITQEPVIWEPLHLGRKDNPFRGLNFGWRQHIPENADWTEAKELFDKLFSGRVLTERILQRSSLKQVLVSKGLLFKFCRGSALLPWLTQNYSFRYKPIYLIRHPFAVVNSQLRHGSWDYKFEKFNIPQTPFNDIYIEHEPFLDTLKTKEEELVAKWCLANYKTLRHADNNSKWLTINYEEFVMNPEKTMNRILSSWGIKYDLAAIDFNKNSSTTKMVKSGSIQQRISNWQHQLDKDQLERMSAVLDYFKINIYSKDNPLPEKVLNYGSDIVINQSM